MLALRLIVFISMSKSKYKDLDRFYLALTACFLLALGAGKTPGQARNKRAPQTSEPKILLTAVDTEGSFVSMLRTDDLRLLQDDTQQEPRSRQQITDGNLSLAN